MRETFEKELRRLQDELVGLGSMVEEALAGSLQALQQRDFPAAQRIIAADCHIGACGIIG